MLYTIALVLIILWLLGLVTSYTMGGVIHVLLVIALVMALIVGTLDRNLHVSDLTACVVLVGIGLASYAALCWWFDISKARGRLKHGFAFFRAKFANSGIG